MYRCNNILIINYQDGEVGIELLALQHRGLVIVFQGEI